MDSETISKSYVAHQTVEVIRHEGKMICMIIRAEPVPDSTVFYTPDDLHLQVGKIVYPANGKIAPHRHNSKRRSIAGSSEVLVVQKGRMIMDIYADGRTIHSSHDVGTGDVVILIAGGHAFHFLEDTVLLEVKQGPYHGDGEREYF